VQGAGPLPTPQIENLPPPAEASAPGTPAPSATNPAPAMPAPASPVVAPSSSGLQGTVAL
jgi:hypothetical protein